MNASEARQRTEDTQEKNGTTMTRLLDHIYKLIGAAADKGERQIIDPLVGLRMPVDPPVLQAVYRELRLLGYDVQFHAGDSRDPRERSWVEVKW